MVVMPHGGASSLDQASCAVTVGPCSLVDARGPVLCAACPSLDPTKLCTGPRKHKGQRLVLWLYRIMRFVSGWCKFCTARGSGRLHEEEHACAFLERECVLAQSALQAFACALWLQLWPSQDTTYRIRFCGTADFPHRGQGGGLVQGQKSPPISDPVDVVRVALEKTAFFVVYCGLFSGVVWCGVVWCGVPKALLPKGKGRDVYPRVKVNGLGCVCCVRAVCKCVVA